MTSSYCGYGAHGPIGNGSLLFQRTPHSWHGMKPLTCPPGKLRKIFSVTLNIVTSQVLWRRIRGKDPDGYRLRAAREQGRGVVE